MVLIIPAVWKTDQGKTRQHAYTRLMWLVGSQFYTVNNDAVEPYNMIVLVDSFREQFYVSSLSLIQFVCVTRGRGSDH